ncbi:ATP-NAD kinase family protein [Candidatus Lokiarchaeum ossiferum]|uniref:ATP-NAD kinase family protein n=1 Tax=Candidatus Lokiarchaeum ossiferum TaxID=2951803 RepID=UPI00352E372E
MIVPAKIGFIINPIAGMGGSVGLKGSDGVEILQKSRELGAVAQANRRVQEFLSNLSIEKKNLSFVSLPGIMGGTILNQNGFNVELLHSSDLPVETVLFETSPYHTKKAAELMLQSHVKLLIFVGGDGTARNIFEAVGTSLPCMGIPAGVKIHSSVFTTNPKTAAELLEIFLEGGFTLRESEVMDIDEDAFRENRVLSKLYGYLMTPYVPTLFQPSKMASPQTDHEHHNQNRMAEWIIQQMDNSGSEYYYLLGPGTTTRAITNLLQEEKTLLGVDLFYKKKLVAKDLNEQQILEMIADHPTKLVVTPIGAQGFIFGRGNLQLSPKVLTTIGLKNIIIIATKYKISTLPDRKMRIDSRNLDFDRKFTGLHRVLVDYGEMQIVDVV